MSTRKTARLFVAIFFIFTAYVLFIPGNVPRLSLSGFLGFVNAGIILYLLLLAIRHFFFLFFAAREEIRREGIGPATEFPGISVIVPAYNEAVVIARTIEELSLLDYPLYEVIVIDDGSSDKTYERALEAATRHTGVTVLRKPNGGKATALNYGIDRAKHELVFCMDADSHVVPKALTEGVRHLADPHVSAVAGAVLVLNQKNATTRFQTLEYLTGLNFYKSAQSFFGLVSIIPGPSGLFRKKVIQDLGGYQSDTFAEDCDLTLRILTSGGRVVYEPGMEVRTEVPENLFTLIKQRYRWNRGILQATRKHLIRIPKFTQDPAAATVILYFLLEGLALPVLNISIALLTIVYQIMTNDQSLFSLWLVQLTLLDLSVVVMTLWDTRWPLRLVLYAVVNRFTYSFFQDIIKILSLSEEFLGIRMGWGKLERVGVKPK